METKTFTVPNISCDHCVKTIKRELGDLPYVLSVDGDAPSKTVTVSYQAQDNLNPILSTLEEIGYPAAS